MKTQAKLLLALALALPFVARPAHAALVSYLTLKGAVQGAIKGEVTSKGKEDTIAVYAFDHATTTEGANRPRLTITKAIEKSSPLLHQAMEKQEPIATFELRLYRPVTTASSGTGTEEQYYTVKLHNAQVVAIHTKQLNTQAPDLVKFVVQEEVTFSYQTIEYLYVKGGITSTGSH